MMWFGTSVDENDPLRLREEALNHLLHAIPEPYPELLNPQAKTSVVVAIPVLGGVQ